MIDQNTSRTELSELGEFGLIEHLTKNIILKNKSTIKGVGDDAAVIKAGDTHLLISTDLLTEGVHFDLTYSPLKHLGYKAAVVNFSDIAAMNGLPTQITVGISASNRFSVEALEELYSGIYMACEKYGVDLIGGDTTSSAGNLFIAITVIGEVEFEDITYRNTANQNDLICVSGDLGGAYMGLLLLEREKQAFIADPNMQPELEGYDYILERQLKPEARIDIVKSLKALGVKPTSMIDISDGLASEIKHICKNSKLGCQIYEEKIPIDITTISMAEEFKMDPTIAALSGGEDYELLFTIKQADYDKIKSLTDISVIGHMTELNEGEYLISRSGTAIELKAQGWDAMKKNEN
ncbi:MAG: thiamine-phosphate kinase [Bacteroidetes bacterium]|nr:thiamine-phosphate kinase [Bacteroidota bacterium]